jgi:hypothetical protein
MGRIGAAGAAPATGDPARSPVTIDINGAA